MNVTEAEALKALENLYRFFDVLTAGQREERDRCVATIRARITGGKQ